MVGGAGESWQQREERRRQVAREARLMAREPAGWLPRLVLVVATAAWLATLAWMAATLPERVPTHWSGGGTPDGWSSRAFAVGFALVTPLVLFYPMLWISRLVMVWPDGVNAPHKEWWLDRPRRLLRFERLLREDLMVIVGLSVLLMAGIGLIMGYAAHRPGGTVPGWWFAALVGGFVGALALVIVRVMTGPRYRPDDDPELA
ncbi:DUF1648 domain-containing protein [Ornithinimicrobium sp. LYQ121]